VLTLPAIRQRLADHTPDLYTAPFRHAAVALVLRGAGDGVEMLIMRRARHNDDPWSGDLSFPGGKVETDDASAQAAAERETREEIGLDLRSADYLGQIDDLTGTQLPVCVSCFVYAVSPSSALQLNHEMTDYWWLPLESFHEIHRHGVQTFPTRSRNSLQPVIDLISDAPVLWGITYRLIESFFALLDTPLPRQRKSI